MQLYFFRHGQAEDAQMPDFDDFSRQLSEKGIRRTKASAQALLKLEVKPTRIYSSPRLRARQTADILAEALGLEVLVREEVGFSLSVQAVESLVADLQDDQSALFVGHEPSLGATLSFLIGGGEIPLKKGGMARIDIYARSPLRGTLAWHITPKMLELIGTN